MNAEKLEQTAQKIRSLFHLAAVLQLTNHMWPTPPNITDESVYDYIIVGGGTAGCIIANRLIKIENATILLVEAGGNPPLETAYPRYFPYLKRSIVDWNFTSITEESMKYNKYNVIDIPQGKMLGGTSNLNYMIYGHGSVTDYLTWATNAEDSSWLYENILPLFTKNENLIDNTVLASPKDSFYYGKQGKIKLRRFYTDLNLKYLNAFRELGHKFLLNVNPKNPLGFTYPLFTCGKKTRQDTAKAFIQPVKNNRRLHVLTNALVTRVLFDSFDNAIGVNILLNNKLVIVMARKEVILSAGTFKTPQLLMLSGIGPRNHLREKNINVRVNLPVGNALQVSPVVITVFRMGDPSPLNQHSNPNRIEFPVIDGYIAMHNHDYPDYIVRSIILDDPAVFLELCVITLSYRNEMCNKLYKQLAGKQIYIAMNHLAYPKSRGIVLLRSSNMKDPPIIKLGLYSNREDLLNHATFLLDFHNIMNTTVFKNERAVLIDPIVNECGQYKLNTLRYWSCYASVLASNDHNYAGTCAVGHVVDSKLLVKGVNRLRIADASVIPVGLSSPIAATVMMVAEKAASLIKKNYYNVQ